MNFTIEDDYIGRTFDFEKLSQILHKNETLKKSNIVIDDIYQLLIETCELHNENVFTNLITSEQYKENHKKIDEILISCNAKLFVQITNIIRNNFDKDFELFSIAKKRNENNFCERLIIELLEWHTDEKDYDLYAQDYIGDAKLKSIIALSGNRTIIRDLINSGNIQNYYSNGDHRIQLYTLYATIGEYEKALTNFKEIYSFTDDLDDEDKTWNTSGYAYGGWGYRDSLARFIKRMCNSFQEYDTDYLTAVSLISQIINDEKVKYLNIEETLTPIKKILTKKDFNLLISDLLEKWKSGNINFLSINEHQDMFSRYIISIASEEEVLTEFNNLTKTDKSRILIP